MNSLTRKQWMCFFILLLVALHPSLLLQLPVLAMLFFMVQPGSRNEIG